MTAASLILLLLKISITLCVLAIGLKATFQDATYLFRRPAQLVRVLTAMNVIMPAVAVAICMSFQLNPAVKIALIGLSVAPIPPILPNKALKAGGQEDFTIGLLVATALLSIIFVPLTVKIFGLIGGLSLQLKPRAVAALVLMSVLLPLLAGIAIRVIAPSFAERVGRPLAICGNVVLIACCLPILFVSIRAVLTLIGDGTLIALAAFAFAGLITGHLLGGPSTENKPVLALASSARHPAVALALAQANFPGQKLAGALILVYLVISAILAFPYLNWVKQGQKHSEFQQTESTR